MRTERKRLCPQKDNSNNNNHRKLKIEHCELYSKQRLSSVTLELLAVAVPLMANVMFYLYKSFGEISVYKA